MARLLRVPLGQRQARAGQAPSESTSIQRADHPATTTVEDMGVDHRRADVDMPEQFLHGADIVARFEQMGRKGVTQRVRGRRFREPGITNRLPHRSLERLIGKMLPPNDASAWSTRTLRRWEDILP